MKKQKSWPAIFYCFRFTILAALTLSVLLICNASAQTENVLYRFGYDHEAYPVSALIRDGQGNLYGTTYGSSSVCCYAGSYLK